MNIILKPLLTLFCSFHVDNILAKWFIIYWAMLVLFQNPVRCMSLHCISLCYYYRFLIGWMLNVLLTNTASDMFKWIWSSFEINCSMSDWWNSRSMSGWWNSWSGSCVRIIRCTGFSAKQHWMSNAILCKRSVYPDLRSV